MGHVYKPSAGNRDRQRSHELNHLARSSELVSFGFSKRDPASKNRMENN